MAIFQKAYRGYNGQLSPLHFRPWVIFRYALREIFSSRIFIAFFVVCFVPSAMVMCVIYLRYNLDTLMQLEVSVNELVYVDAAFFAEWVLGPQLFFVFVLTMFVGPTLVSPDLRNNAMPLYLSRPISKLSYIGGKYLVLLALGSAISWIPTLLLIFYQGYLAGAGWFGDNAHLPLATIIASLTWITCLAMLSLAISATVKWAPIARLAFFGMVFVASALGQIINLVVGGWTGSLFSLSRSMETVVQTLYGLRTTSSMPGSAAAMVLLAVTVVSLFILLRRIRANEVVA